MKDYIFRLANQNDISDIVDIYHSNIGVPGCTWDLDYPSIETAEDDIKNEWLYVLEKDNKIIAVASAGDFDEPSDIQWEPKNPCELGRIGVIPSMHNQGIGTIILDSIMKAMKEKGFDGMKICVSKTNPAAIVLYEKNGFKKCGEVYKYDIDFYCYQICFNDVI